MLLFYQVRISPATKPFIPYCYHLTEDFVYVGCLHHHLLQKEYLVNLKLIVVVYDLMENVRAKDAQKKMLE